MTLSITRGRRSRSWRRPDCSDQTLMPETLTKLRPDRDLQCYYQEPSAIAALSETSATGLQSQAVGGTIRLGRCRVESRQRNRPPEAAQPTRWRSQRTAVVLRGDADELHPSRFEHIRFHWVVRTANLGVLEQPGKPSPRSSNAYATPIEGSYTPAVIDFEDKQLDSGDYVELAWLDQHVNYLVTNSDTLDSVVEGLASTVNAMGDTAGATAIANGPRITLTCTAAKGGNANRIRRIRRSSRRGNRIVVS